MLTWFKSKKKSKETVTEAVEVIPMKPMNYHPKIILAWAKAVDGNVEIATWLTDNGFQELTIACSAIRLKDEARTWLMQNGYPHLMAMINAAEGNTKAAKWLEINKMDLLFLISQAVEDNQKSWAWLKHNATQDLFILAQSIKIVKDKIEERHNDIHSFGGD
jgi:hypothetical protein